MKLALEKHHITMMAPIANCWGGNFSGHNYFRIDIDSLPIGPGYPWYVLGTVDDRRLLYVLFFAIIKYGHGSMVF
jgi:hypothetical protein